jgi:ferredoxin
MPHLVIFDKDGERHEADVDIGMDLFDAAEAAGVTLPHSCGRGGWCSTCAVRVIQGKIGDGQEISPPMGPEEEETMQKAGLPLEDHVLSCSCQIFGDVIIQEAGADDVQSL